MMKHIALALLLMAVALPAQGLTRQWHPVAVEWTLHWWYMTTTGPATMLYAFNPDGALTAFKFQAGGDIQIHRTIAITNPATPTIVSVTLDVTLPTQTLSVPFGPEGEPLEVNSPPLNGSAIFNLLIPGGDKSIELPLATTTQGIGLGGMITFNGYSAGNGLKVSVIGRPWTLATTVIAAASTSTGRSVDWTEHGFWGGGRGTGIPRGSTAMIVTRIQTQGGSLPFFAPNGVIFLGWRNNETINLAEPNSTLSLLACVGGLVALGRRRMKR
jgi:hypothetical protein